MTTQYGIYCIDEVKNIYSWRDTPPTTCPNNVGHNVNSNSVFINDTRPAGQPVYYQESHNFSLLDPIYHNGSVWVKAKADNVATLGTHLVSEILNTDEFGATQSGRIIIPSHGLTVGNIYYTSDQTLGTLTNVEPNTYSNPVVKIENDDVMVVLGWRSLHTNIAGGGMGGTLMMMFRDQKTTGTNAGTFTKDGWRLRELNQSSGNGSFGTLSNNQITLDSGIYNINAFAPAYKVEFNKIRLYNVSDSEVVVTGTSRFASSEASPAMLSGYISIDSAKTFQIEHYGNRSRSNDGFGVACGFSGSPEVYTTVNIVKLG
jgi:hypothetical protein